MSVWDTYKSRVCVSGSTAREESLLHEKWYFSDRSKDGLFCHDVKLNGEDTKFNIINSDNFNEKLIYSMPDETFPCGGYVEWADNTWLITEKDANNEVYTRGKIIQCNYLLKWVDPESHTICERWAVVEDGTKYLTGIYEDRNFIVTRGDTRMAVTLPKDAYTAKLNRESRFIVDDPDSDEKMTYLLTKPLKSTRLYNGEGVYVFVMQEVVSTDDDNMELSIADYYKYFPKVSDNIEYSAEDTSTDNDKNAEVWI